jgi:hypothetical protein
MLDDCLFTSNLSAGVIAHNLVDAKAFFRDKIKFAYDTCPSRSARSCGRERQRRKPALQQWVQHPRWRLAALRYASALHVSEYGKLCAKYPDRAEEVKTGAFNTVAVGQNITVESTAEGRAGEFHDMVKKARQIEERGVDADPARFQVPLHRLVGRCRERA